MPTSRRNVFVRTVVAACGDVAATVAIAAACAWLIEFAALGVFLSFLAWLVGALLSLAFSQYVVHPAVAALLCDRKLDAVVVAGTTLVGTVDGWARSAFATLHSRVVPA